MEKKQLFRTENLKQLLQRYKYALLVVLVGVLLLSFGGGTHDGAKAESTIEEEIQFDLEVMERKLEQALSKVSGAGRVTVVLSLKEGIRRVLAQDTRITDNEQDKTTVIVSHGSGMEDPVLLQSVYPRYQGALVVCDGADSAAVRLELLEAVRVLTGLSSEKISICKRQ